MKLARPIWQLAKWTGGCLRDIVLVGLWLLFAIAIAIQIGVATSHQFPTPEWLLRKVESRLTVPGLRVQIGSATIIPDGQIFLRDVRFTPFASDTPIAQIETMQIKLSRLALLAREVEPQQVEISGLTFTLPAMFSASGQSESILSGVQLSFGKRQNGLVLDQCSGRLGKLTFAIQGDIQSLHSLLTKPGAEKEIQGFTPAVQKRYIDFARKLSDAEAYLKSTTQPHLSITLRSIDNALIADIIFTARKLDWDGSSIAEKIGRIHASDFRLGTSLPVGTELPPQLELKGSCAEAKVGDRSIARDARFQIEAKSNPASEQKRFVISKITATFDEVSSSGIEIKHPVVTATLPSANSVAADVVAEAANSAWHLRSLVNHQSNSAEAHIEGAVTPELIKIATADLNRDPDGLVKLKQPAPIQATVIFADGWKLSRAHGSLTTGPLLAYSVPFDSIRGDFNLEGADLLVSNIHAKQGENRAIGSYAMNFRSHAFEFLLGGQLRPADISGFFENWWRAFWSNFDFSPAPPVADVSVKGRWGAPYLTTVFVNVDVQRPHIRQVPFDRVQTTMFIRPDFYHALTFDVAHGSRGAHGTFTRAVDLTRDTDALKFMDFAAKSNLDLASTAKLFGQEGIETVEPFTFGTPPNLSISGHIDGPASASGPRRVIDLEVDSTGDFALYHFPLNNLSFRGAIRDREIDLQNIKVSFAQGEATGSARLSGVEEDRRLEFDCALSNARLGEAIHTLETFAAKERGEAPPATSKFQQQIAQGRLNLKLAAQGKFSDMYSYFGHGYLDLNGAQLAQINLLGTLSQILSKTALFRFTALQLNEAHSRFVLERDSITFPDLKISGYSALIDSKGTYSLAKNQMDFTAKVYPFAQGKTALASAVGFVLTPLSNALELKLSGALEKPSWRLTYGPTNFLYNITGTKPEDVPASPQESPDISRRLPPPYLRR
ncbi:MAG: AsmA-like C-terminal region-containing protein [Nibricoccus sp.]